MDNPQPPESGAADPSPFHRELTRVMEALQEVTHEQEVADLVVKIALPVLSAVAATVVVHRDGMLHNLRYHGNAALDVQQQFQTVALDAPVPAAEVVRTGEALFLTHLQLQDQYPEAKLALAHPAASLVVLPFKTHGRVLGVLGLSFEGHWPDSPEALHFMEHLSHHCAQALDRARLIEDLSRSEARFRSLVEATTSMVWTRNPLGEIVHPQPQWEQVTGQTWEEYRGMGWLNAIHPEDREQAERSCLQGIHSQQTYQVEYRVRQGSGGYRQMQVNAVPIFRDGKLEEWMGFHRDITREKEALQAARDSEARLSGIISTVSDAVVTTGPDRKILVFNQAAAKMFGLPAEEAIGSSLDRFIPARFHPQHAQHMQGFGRTGVTSRSMHGSRHALPALRANGEEFLVEATISQVVVSGEKLFTAVVRDVTEQIRVQQQLRESEERFRATFSQAAVGIAHVSLEGRWLSVNQRLCEIVGYPEEELLSLAFQDITHPEDLDKDLFALRQLLRGDISTYQLQKRYIRKGGEVVWINLTVSMVQDEAGQPKYLISVIEDISQVKQTEQQLIEARDGLELRVEERTLELTTLSEKLSEQVQELEARNLETQLLGEMSEMLQACLSIEEAQQVVAQHAMLLLPEASGTLYSFGASRNLLEEMVRWNGTSSSAAVFTPMECWGLRRGKTFFNEQAGRGLRCQHMEGPDPALCVPLLAQGETVGLLHLSAKQGFSLRWQRLAQIIGETVALAIVNLRLRESLRQQSIRDPLTGLFNRRYLEETFDREVRRAVRHQQPIGAIMLDVDHFKRFNDLYGHEAGDTLLTELGRILQTSIRGEDVACRYGGEEFTLLLPGATLEQTAVRAEQVRQAVASMQVSNRGETLPAVTASLGVAAYPMHGDQLNLVLRAADFALYRAKQEGRNRVITVQQE